MERDNRRTPAAIFYSEGPRLDPFRTVVALDSGDGRLIGYRTRGCASDVMGLLQRARADYDARV